MKERQVAGQQLNCFIAMPISDVPEYEVGHFSRVYEHLIKPACMNANLKVDRADEVQGTNLIILEILKRVFSADLVVFDLSSRNPNVFYELGIRQAFDLPVVLIKDSKTNRVFDIQGLRTLEYDVSLRIDSVQADVRKLETMIIETLSAKKSEINSMIRLLEISKAELPKLESISADTSLILDSLQDISRRITSLEVSSEGSPRVAAANRKELILPNGESVRRGESLYDSKDSSLIGKFEFATPNGLLARLNDGKVRIIPSSDELYERLTTIPF